MLVVAVVGEKMWKLEFLKSRHPVTALRHVLDRIVFIELNRFV